MRVSLFLFNRESGLPLTEPQQHSKGIAKFTFRFQRTIWRKSMRFFRFQNVVLALSLLAIAGFVATTTVPITYAQTNTTGALSGVVSDSTGAVVPGATVVVIDTATDAKQNVVTNSVGRYSAGLLKPGVYRVTASATNLQSETLQVTVILGTTATADIKVTPKGDKTIVQVTSSDLPLVDTQNVALASTFSENQIQQLPTPGGDVTTVAYTAPGVVMNAGGGGAGGNFSSDGLPGISNLFVLNGFDNQDPFLNLNNSGSSNLTLGQGELADATVIQNAYNSQYGRAAGAIISYTTKSGGNKYHGEAIYDYNGTVLNANGWFNNATGTPRPHAVSNEWALNGGGPIIKDKLFFFSDWEGLHYVLPNSGFVSMPTAQYEAAALGMVPSGATSTYQQMFNLYNSSPVYSSATPVALTPLSSTAGANLIANGGGCGVQQVTANGQPVSPTNPGTPLGGWYDTPVPGSTTNQMWGVDVPCAVSGFAQANSFNKEWLFTQRIDWNITDNHKIYGRFKMDHGTQPTNTNLVNPAFNTVSVQPEYEGQFNDAYTISSHLVNSAVVAANWYSAFFGPSNIAAAQTALPFWAYFNVGADGSGTPDVGGFTNLGVPSYFPQGRDVTQYQLEDDLSWTHGAHNWKFGVNFRRDLVTDYDAEESTDFPFLLVYSLNDIAQGALSAPGSAFAGGDEFQQAFVTAPHAHLALYNMGIYVQDDWQALPKLKLTLGVRLDRTGDPLCHGNCFSLYNGSFIGSTSTLSSAYNTLIDPAKAHPYGSQIFNVQPRFGFNYELDSKTGIRGGAGLFADLYPAGFLDGPIQNFPNYNLETIYSGTVAGGGTGSLPAFAATANSAVQSGFATGSASSINSALSTLGVPFSPPNLNAVFGSTFKEPQYLEWSLQFQRQLTKTDGVSITYAGNYGYNEILQNPFANASSGAFNQTAGAWAQVAPFAGLPAAPANPSFGEVNAFTNNAHSNYNGAMATYTHQGHGITAHLTYTWSHALDMISNGGIGQTFGQASITKQLTPNTTSYNLNYSNADYDIRHNVAGDLVYEEPFKMQNKAANLLVSGWVVSAKTYYRTGEPLSVNNTNALASFPSMAAINNTQGLTSLMPQITVAQSRLTNGCISPSHAAVAASTPCLDSTQYASSQSTFGNLRRNVLYGPHYADTDATLSKQIVKTEGAVFTIGAQAYNVFNHVNFNAPGTSVGTGSFGVISTVQAPPTSPYGSFQGAAVTQRVLVVTGKVTF
jgi:hypothetical protein